jgi:NAD(P)-dependent dehydrogenase (short-subunit alcohol dehydrogenase family)
VTTTKTDANEVVVITGAGAGIGYFLAGNFLALGKQVVAVDADADALKELSRTQATDRLHIFAADVRDAARASSVLAEVRQKLGAPSILINGAAIVRHSPTLDSSPELWREIIDINLNGSFIWSAEAARLMAAEKYGRVISITSHAGILGTFGRGAYSASKAGLSSLMRTLAVELACYGITANAVAPGPVETPRVSADHTDERRQAWAERIPLKRYGRMEELASLINFLASPASGYITGQTIAVDGGFSTAGLLADA